MLEEFKKVEIEIQSYCNRKCGWCPNIEIDRSFYHEMPEHIFLKILKELKDAGFADGEGQAMISFSRYNEPLFNVDLLKKRVHQVKQYLPKAVVVTNTNGDYLKKESLDNLGLNELTVMDYDNKGKGFILNRFKKLEVTYDREDQEYIYGYYGSMRIRYMNNWPEKIQLEDRGGFFKKELYYNKNEEEIPFSWANRRSRRKYPCDEPKRFIAIDYNGNVMPCCHMRSDNPKHDPYILGNVKDRTLISIVKSKKATEIRNNLESMDYKSFPKPCYHCHKQRADGLF